jgi:hypothetical protein
VKERGHVKGVGARAVDALRWLRFEGGVARFRTRVSCCVMARLPGICSPRLGCMVRSGHDPQGLNQLADVATGVGVMPIPSSLGVVSELHATARGWRQRISPSRRP